MEEFYIHFDSVSLAARARKALLKRKIKGRVTKKTGNDGCEFSLLIEDESKRSAALEILSSENIKYKNEDIS